MADKSLGSRWYTDNRLNESSQARFKNCVHKYQQKLNEGCDNGKRKFRRLMRRDSLPIASLKRTDAENAISHFSRGLELDPLWYDAYHFRGHCYESQDDWEKAIEDFERYLEHVPTDEHAQQILTAARVGKLRTELNGTASPRSVFSNVTQEYWDNPVLLRGLASLLLNTSESDQHKLEFALKAALRAEDISTNDNVVSAEVLAKLNSALGKWDDDARWQETAITRATAEKRGFPFIQELKRQFREYADKINATR